MTSPTPPRGLKSSGRALWKAVLAQYALDEHELTILREASRTADALDALQTTLDNEGHMSSSSQGIRVHPVLPELRQQRIAFARLITALRIPAGEVNDGRGQVRGGLRGVHGICGA